MADDVPQKPGAQQPSDEAPDGGDSRDEGYGSAHPSDGGARLLSSVRKDEIMEASLVLASQSLRHWIEFDGGEFHLYVDERDARAAGEILELYRTENRGFQDSAVERGELDLFLAPLFFLAVPVFFYFWVESMPWAHWWHDRGTASARLILDGEWWRCLTATNLHADHGHFLSNLVSGYFILNLLNHRMRIGAIMVLATLGGAGANFVVALTSPPEHLSIGFSSVVFAVLGILAATETWLLPRRKDRSLRRLSPLLSAFFVAILVGLGEGVDVKAHFYGFGLGAALGVAAKLLPAKWEKRIVSGPAPMQAALILSVYAANALAWFLALRNG